MRFVLVMLALLFSAALPASAVAEANPVPQAPVLPVIPKTEVLPFTIEGGGDIQVAVLSGQQTVADATWQTRSNLPLIDYAGQDIRVLARGSGVSDPADYFDAEYKVRDSYPPGQGLGTEANPFVGIAGNDLRFRAWASGWENYEPGTDVAPSWQTPPNAIGPVGGTGYDGNMSVVVLGNGGRITMTFERPIIDKQGPDFAVFENGFRISGSTSDFIELGYVEVSSNGTDFVRFDSGTTHTVPIGAFAGYPADRIDGVAGRDLNGYGTPFDLTSLKNKAAVRGGLVDLNNITRVRIVDIQGTEINGAPTDLDSFGRAIYDPWKTVGSGGFDLRGVGVINRPGASIVQTSIKGTNSTSAEVTTNVAGGAAGGQTVELQFSESETDHGDAVVKATGSSPADGSNVELKLTAAGLVAGTDYWYRVVAKDASGEPTATEWKQFSKTPVSFTVSSQAPAKLDGKVTIKLGGQVATNTEGDQTVVVEAADNAGFENPIRSEEFPAGLIWADFSGLNPNSTYWYRLVSRGPDGATRISEVKQVSTSVAPRVGTQTLLATKGDTVVFRATLAPGTVSGDVTSYLEFSTTSNMANPINSPSQTLDGDADSLTPVYTMSGLSNVRYYIRTVMIAGNGSILRAGGTIQATPPGTAATINAPSVTTLGQAATFASQTGRGSYGRQKVFAEVSVRADHSDEYVKSPVFEHENTSVTAQLQLDGLKPDTTYWVRTATESMYVDHRAETAWVEFKSERLTPAIVDSSVGTVTPSGALVSAEIDPGSFARQVRVEYSAERPGLNVKRSASQPAVAGSGSQTLTFGLEDLKSNREHWYRVVSSGAGQTEKGAWKSFSTAKTAAEIMGQSASEIGTGSARVRVTFRSGDDEQIAHVEYRPSGGGGVSRTAGIEASAGAARRSLGFDLSGLDSHTGYEFRLVLTAGDGPVVESDWDSFTTRAEPAVIVGGEATEVGVHSAKVEVRIDAVDLDQRVVIVHRPVGEDVSRVSSAQEIPAGSVETLSFPIAGLKAKSGYEFRAVATGTDGGQVVGEWVGFTTGTPDPAAVRLTVDRTRVRAGESVTLNWSSDDAETLSAEGVWSGTKTAKEGSQAIRLDRPGTFTFGLVASGEGGNARAEVTVTVDLPAAKLGLKLAKAKVRRGGKQRVSVTGLTPGETVRVVYAGRRVSPAGATADSNGAYSIRFAVGRKLAARQVRVVGSFEDRINVRKFRVTRAR